MYFQRTWQETGGMRQCNCRMEMVQKNMGNGRVMFSVTKLKISSIFQKCIFQKKEMVIRYSVTVKKITQQQKCDRCPNVKLVSEDDDLDIQIDKGKLP